MCSFLFTASRGKKRSDALKHDGKRYPSKSVLAEEKPLSFTLDGQSCINLNSIRDIHSHRPIYCINWRERWCISVSHTHTHIHTPDLVPVFGGEGRQGGINITMAKWMSIHLITRKQLPLSRLLLSCFSAPQKHPKTWRKNILKGCTQSLPILLWQNDHPAMPNVDQERERWAEHRQKEFWVIQCQW